MKLIKFVYEFFFWLGQQNDYLYPDKNCKCWHPYEKAHLWKTRFGFKTSWDLAKIITGWRF